MSTFAGLKKEEELEKGNLRREPGITECGKC